MGARHMTSIKSHAVFSSLTGEGSASNVVNLPVRKLLTESVEEWRESVQERLQELIRLDRGWDGYEGLPVSFVNAVFALRMLESVCRAETHSPEIVPGVSGDLQVEWHTFKGDIELHVRAPNDVHAWRSKSDDDADGEELELTNDFSVIATWVRELTEPPVALRTAAA